MLHSTSIKSGGQKPLVRRANCHPGGTKRYAASVLGPTSLIRAPATTRPQPPGTGATACLLTPLGPAGPTGSVPVLLSLRLSLCLWPLLSAVSRGSPRPGRAADLYRSGYKLPLPWTWLHGGAGGLIQFGFFSYFPTLSPALSLLCQLSEMLCLTGSLSQISYHLKPLGRERWRPRKGSKWVYQCFFTPRELLDTKGKGIKDLKRAQKRESSL